MRIAHVVTFASADGAFGGPTQVALGQAKALAQLGHEVTVYAGAPAGENGDYSQDGYRLRTFAATSVAPFGGFATLWPRGLVSAVRSHAPNLDVAHIHLARDLATLPSALALHALKVPFVAQPHGMIDKSEKKLASVLDKFATRRALAAAACWLVLTDEEQQHLTRMTKPASVARIRNGIEPAQVSPLADRPETVLFLARLHERKRPTAFVEMATKLASQLPETNFVLAGPDEGEGEAVTRAIESAGLGDRLQWIGALAPSQTRSAFSQARVYVLPSVNEVFPMSILEAFNAGTPVVTTSSLGIAQKCLQYGAALVTDGTPDELARATLTAYGDAKTAEGLRRGARRYIDAELNIQGVAFELQEHYARATEMRNADI